MRITTLSGILITISRQLIVSYDSLRFRVGRKLRSNVTLVGTISWSCLEHLHCRMHCKERRKQCTKKCRCQRQVLRRCFFTILIYLGTNKLLAFSYSDILKSNIPCSGGMDSLNGLNLYPFSLKLDRNRMVYLCHARICLVSADGIDFCWLGRERIICQFPKKDIQNSIIIVIVFLGIISDY